MAWISDYSFPTFIIILLLLVTTAASTQDGKGIKTMVSLSPAFEMEPGLVSRKFYFNVDFPRGHIAIKSFDAEVVDSKGKPVPLYDTYLHHWLAMRYIRPKMAAPGSSNYTIIGNSGVCGANLPQYFGLGAETRRTATFIPDPYGIESGNPAQVPAGYEEGWVISVHAIDTRGVKDRMGCAECRCDLYNITKDEDGNPLSPDYPGGLLCCPDGAKCRLRKGFKDVKRNLFLRYTFKYVDWDSSILPVKIYILDVADKWNGSKQPTGHDCQVEYQVEPCPASSAKDRCINTKKVAVPLPSGGDVIYGVAHQHAGALGSTLYGQDGRVICSSTPIYGKGREAGNEYGYVVGMSTCYPKPGNVKISAGELLTLESKYSNAKRHTGVMGLFYLLVAEHSP